jgi:hypothetical protein
MIIIILFLPRCMINRFFLLFHSSLFCHVPVSSVILCDFVFRPLLHINKAANKQATNTVTVVDIQCTSTLFILFRSFFFLFKMISSCFLRMNPFVSLNNSVYVCVCVNACLPISFSHSGCINKRDRHTNKEDI